MSEAVGLVALREALGGPESLLHGAVGQEGHEGPLEELRVARVLLERLAIKGRGGGRVASGAGDIGGEEIALQAFGGLEQRRLHRLRRQSAPGERGRCEQARGPEGKSLKSANHRRHVGKGHEARLRFSLDIEG